jgi:anti-sigma regulatory factor (Ser/Thr protein kinase)
LARAFVRDAAVELELDGSTTWDIMLATTEAVANAIEHGAPCEPGGIRVRVETNDGMVEVEVSDCGECFAPGAHTKKPDLQGGRGIPIIAAIMDHLEVVPDSGVTRVRFEKRLVA